MTCLDDEVRAARRQKRLTNTYRLHEGHGLHVFVFMSIILAETLNRIIETWTRVRSWTPDVVFLFTMTLLTAQYWWVVYESAFFYGKTIVNFGLGALEAALFYAVAYCLHSLHSLRSSFFLFSALVFLFVVVDLRKYRQYLQDFQQIPENERQDKPLLQTRQILRVAGIVISLLGGFGVNAWFVAWALLLLVLFYTWCTECARRQVAQEQLAPQAQQAPQEQGN